MGIEGDARRREVDSNATLPIDCYLHSAESRELEVPDRMPCVAYGLSAIGRPLPEDPPLKTPQKNERSVLKFL
jgi:hypothetical protein